jgi:uncharacterized protein
MKEYINRTYRNKILSSNLNSYHVTVRETDLLVTTNSNLEKQVHKSVIAQRSYLESYIKLNPEFLSSLVPVRYDSFAPEIVKDMIFSSTLANVGPMASVAGAIAKHVGEELLSYSADVIIENGGDVFIKSKEDVIIQIFAGESALSDKIRIKVDKDKTPLGVCTSSGTVGPSLSFGKADAVTVISKSPTLADAAATSIGNLVLKQTDIRKGLARAQEIEGVLGVVIIVGGEMGIWGDVELVR